MSFLDFIFFPNALQSNNSWTGGSTVGQHQNKVPIFFVGFQHNRLFNHERREGDFNLVADYLSCAFFGRRNFACVFKPLKAEIKPSFQGKTSSTKQNRNQISLMNCILEKH